MPDVRHTHLRGDSKRRTECGLPSARTKVVKSAPSCPLCAASLMDPTEFREQEIPIPFLGVEIGHVRVHQNPGEEPYYSFTPGNPKGFTKAPATLLRAYCIVMSDALNLGELWREQSRSVASLSRPLA